MAEKKKVLLIGWDGADWEHINPLIEEGLLPTLDGLINGGVMGNLATLEPVLSPMLWNSVATGKHAHKHGIHGFVEPTENEQAVQPFSSRSRKTKALWNIFSQNGIRSNVINWWASHPAEKINGCVVSNLFNGVKFDPSSGDWKIADGTIHPQDIQQAFAKFKVFENELGAEHILPFVPDAANIDQTKDKRLGVLAKVLTETATTHSIATAVMETQPWDFMAVYYTGIDHFSHAFMQYHPPRMPNTPKQDFEMYGDVIKGAYRFHDMMLARLLELAGDDTTVVLCSDHGFQSGSFRPMGTPREPAGPAIWHRRYGIVVLNGKGIKKDERIYGASLIDIGPTILSLYGLPIGEDMDGQPLLQAFENPPEIKTIPSWDEVDGDHGFGTFEEVPSGPQSKELLKQFIALGYVEDQSDDMEKQVFSAKTETKYNLARNLMWQSKYDEALPLLEEIVKSAPWENRFIIQLGDCYLNAGYARQAEKLIASAFEIEKTKMAQVVVLFARVKARLDEPQKAVELLKRAVQLTPKDPALHTRITNLFIRRRMWKQAEASCQKALSLHPENSRALELMSTICLRTGRPEEAGDYAMDALALLHRMPRAHFNLGVAMARLKHFDRAVIAFSNSLKFQRTMRNAHRWLATIYRTGLEDPKLAKQHADQALMLSAMPQNSKKRPKNDRREVLFDLPDFESEQARNERVVKERPRRSDPVKKSGKTFVLVSGLPRSGTSLMMQMLTAGGLNPVTDNQRVADENNPRGYYEWEDIKQIAKRPELLDDIESNSAIKVVSMLLQSLPREHDYKIVFMVRPLEEVAQSQATMIDKLGTDGASIEHEELLRGLHSHLAQTVHWMKEAPNVEFIDVFYPNLIKDPMKPLESIIEFIGTDLISSPDEMTNAIDTSLYRQRKSRSD